MLWCAGQLSALVTEWEISNTTLEEVFLRVCDLDQGLNQGALGVDEFAPPTDPARPAHHSTAPLAMAEHDMAWFCLTTWYQTMPSHHSTAPLALAQLRWLWRAMPQHDMLWFSRQAKFSAMDVADVLSQCPWDKTAAAPPHPSFSSSDGTANAWVQRVVIRRRETIHPSGSERKLALAAANRTIVQFTSVKASLLPRATGHIRLW